MFQCIRLVGLVVMVVGVAQAADSPQVGQDGWASRALASQFDDVHQLIKPQPGESRWMEIPWQTSLWTAREIAAKEGKPIFLWFGSGGSPACHT